MQADLAGRDFLSTLLAVLCKSAAGSAWGDTGAENTPACAAGLSWSEDLVDALASVTNSHHYTKLLEFAAHRATTVAEGRT